MARTLQRQRMLIAAVVVGILILIVLKGTLGPSGRATEAKQFAGCTATVVSENGKLLCYGLLCEDPAKAAVLAEVIGCDEIR